MKACRVVPEALNMRESGRPERHSMSGSQVTPSPPALRRTINWPGFVPVSVIVAWPPESAREKTQSCRPAVSRTTFGLSCVISR